MSVLLSRITVCSIRNCCAKTILLNSIVENAAVNRARNFTKKLIPCFIRQFSISNIQRDIIEPTTALENSTIPLKKKVIHKKVSLEDVQPKDGQYLAIAYATANSYDLKSINEALLKQKLYEPATLTSAESGDVVVASAVYNVDKEPRQMFFFKEGAVVFWNCTELEASNVLSFVQRYEMESYPQEVVEKEREIMPYTYHQNIKKCHLQDSCFILVPERNNTLERYAFSHAMAQSARLGAWEARLGALAAAVAGHSRSMEQGHLAQTRDQIVRKLGELFSLRHRLNVESDLLDTPDFYWEEEQLEKLYSNTVAYFTIPRRTRVLNERLSHCVELLELLSQWASDKHHVRLEWMIIALILIEVCFELLHFFEREILTKTEWRTSQPLLVNDQHMRPYFESELEEHIFQDISILDTY